MAQRDLIVSFLSSTPKAVLQLFKEPPLQAICPVTGKANYATWLSQFKAGGKIIPGLARHAGAKPGDTIGRVAVMGFSNGCYGVSEFLRADDSNKADVVLAVDGIHESYGDGKLVPGYYKSLMNRAAQSATENPEVNINAPVTVYTHSAIVPPGFPSTTETTGIIWELVYARTYNKEGSLLPDCSGCLPANTVNALAAENTKKVQLCQQGECYDWNGFADGLYDVRFLNSFYVLGWGDLVEQPVSGWDPVKHYGVKTRDPRGYTDHQFQGKYVLPALLREFCVKRWQVACEPVATIGFGDDAACSLPRGNTYEETTKPKVDFFPDLVGPGEPAKTVVMDRFEAPSGVGKYLAMAAGMAAGYASARYVVGRRP